MYRRANPGYVPPKTALDARFVIILKCVLWILGGSKVYLEYVVHANNEEFIRLQALNELTDETYRKEVISDDVVGYVAEGKYPANPLTGNIHAHDCLRIR